MKKDKKKNNQGNWNEINKKYQRQNNGKESEVKGIKSKLLQPLKKKIQNNGLELILKTIIQANFPDISKYQSTH